MSSYYLFRCVSCGESSDFEIRSGHSGLKLRIGEDHVPFGDGEPLRQFLDAHEHHEMVVDSQG